ncbi:MAG: ABC transporter ATP-binding protein [Deltaproteobacteria bacterium]|nr:ABC transporter ATP-binding protein [Deltaproteobacteria bacterium]
MNQLAIKVEGLSKQYLLGSQPGGHRTLRESLIDWAKLPFRTLPNTRKAQSPSAVHHWVWALKEVSFEVKKGEVVGIIGRNGAGKSTLLKILSRITEPTAGQAEIHGRVGSLLEVGTGFHHELTGRENIFLSGAILGMKKAEIRRKFEAIVDFAEVERFIDTPVKHYSSGMLVRLAFAVAAHLETEVLLVDEVLAVGDISFQKKCLGKMRETTKEGRTVLFVSHQMSSITGLCSRALQIHQGLILQDGEPEAVVRQYLIQASDTLKAEFCWGDAATRPGNEQIRLIAVRVVNECGESRNVFGSSEPISVEMEFDLLSDHPALFIGFDLFAQNGVFILRSCHNHGPQPEWPKLSIGRNRLRGTIPTNLLNTGIYHIAPRVALNFIQWIVTIDPLLSFHVQMDHCQSPFWNSGHSMVFPGTIAPCLPWRSMGTEKGDRTIGPSLMRWDMDRPIGGRI